MVPGGPIAVGKELKSAIFSTWQLLGSNGAIHTRGVLKLVPGGFEAASLTVGSYSFF
jgi:hypothetical protein